MPDERLVEVPFAFVVLTGPGTAPPEEILDCAGDRPLPGLELPKHRVSSRVSRPSA
ncbi:hypothetical protein LWC35_12445 [Pseudonocardia kujensis]|uniref:hypothetical protein n=1 Tax=Pseudonocardia kujensis TaxID=1128675 RepID=UPI001E466B07|nr:hypothetical protein [Pseudonocardia kujensis]MCE0763710.1 hypothetical protein [Pseudonocardia kujensis]